MKRWIIALSAVAGLVLPLVPASLSAQTRQPAIEMQANHPDMRLCDRAMNRRGCRCALQVGGRIMEVTATGVRWHYEAHQAPQFSRCMTGG